MFPHSFIGYKRFEGLHTSTTPPTRMGEVSKVIDIAKLKIKL